MDDQPQPKPLTLDAIYGPENKVDFDGDYAKGMVWTADGDHYWLRRDGTLLKVETETGQAEPAFDHDALQHALRQLAALELDEKEAQRLVSSIKPDRQHPGRVLLEHDDRLILCELTPPTARVLTPEPAERLDATLSPRGEHVVYHQAGDLYLIARATGEVRRLTDTGSENLLNGRLDWVYQEEVYGRGNWRANWFRDDDAFLAFLQLDQADVPTFTILDHREPKPAANTYHYPRPGDPNPQVRLGVTRLDDGHTVWIDLDAGSEQPLIVARVGWAPDGRLIFEVQDREGTWLELRDADPLTGAVRTLVREETPAWVNVQPLPLWCHDGSFVWRSERDGWAHLYHYTRDGELIDQLTAGDWEVRAVHGIDQETGRVYFSGTRDALKQDHVYRVDVRSGEIERLTEPGAFHQASFDPTFRYFFDTHSNAMTPPRVHLRTADGALARVLSPNEVPALTEYQLVAPEFFTVPNAGGFAMPAMLYKPPDFNPAKSYPVICETYGGPHAPLVRDVWHGQNGLFRQLMAQQGFLYWICDPETASAAGMQSAWKAYEQLGVREAADLATGVEWLTQHPWADGTRVGLNGWSYGGFLTAFTLTQTDVFAVAIAGAPVTDWRFYDTIYTERFMRTPANNPEGYQKASVIENAHNLSGRLLLVHGTLDDNVHLQNTLKLVYRLQEHGKEFDLMLYPGNKHGIRDHRRHWVQLRHDYFIEHLQPSATK